ncbi:MAG: hypothetical protein PVF19_14640 [Gemmatimonadota bacterium]
MKNVPRIGRILDLVGLVLFGVGGVLFGWAWVGFREVQAYVPPPDAPLWSAVGVADGYWRLQKVGGGLMIGGVAVFVLAWWTARAVASRSLAEFRGTLPDDIDGG